MSSIKLESNASGTGIFTIASPNSNTNRTLTLPDNTGTILTGSSAITRSQLPAGSVLQVVSTTKTDTASTTSTSFSDVSGLSVTITPTSSTSKIFIILTLGSVGNTVNTVKFNILRNSTNIAQPASGGNSSTINHFPGATVSATGDCASFLDSPATTSAITYKIQWAVDGSTGYLNRHTGNTDYNSVSTITAMEIAA
jgi:hypothetical protein